MLAHKKYLYCVFAALFSAANTSGQMTKQDSLHVFQDNRAVNYFDLTGNAATIDMTPFAQQGFAKISAITINGDFRRPMEAEASNPISLATGGFKKINGWSYLTNFTTPSNTIQTLLGVGLLMPTREILSFGQIVA
jgi:hypothetical protein